MGKSKRKIIAIVGPTASGKTGWGVSIARKWGGEIISADSRQVYRGLDIGTGKEGVLNPKLKAQMSKEIQSSKIKKYIENIRWIGDVPQWMIDIVEPEADFSMFDWLSDVRQIIEEIFARGKTPIIVGGTGLYVQSLCEGFEIQKSKFKNQNDNIKCKIYSRLELEKKSLKELQTIFQKLTAKSQQLKAIDLHNPHRLIRAIERYQSGEEMKKVKPDFEVLQIAVDLPREVLYERIDSRVEQWFEQGFLEEVKNLITAGVDINWLEAIGLEYRILTHYLIENSLKIVPKGSRREKLKIENYSSFADMMQKMKFAIHAYARRQLTWFRRFLEIIWCKDLLSAEKEIQKFLNK